MDREALIDILRDRFERNPHRHPDYAWKEVEQRLREDSALLEAVLWMEESGGEPDLASLEGRDRPIYVDFSKESPEGRRSLCYDREARIGRKKNAPASSVLEKAEEAGLSLVDEALYYQLQDLEPLDEKTQSWVVTPPEIRRLGGAIFCDRRFGRTFTYHNGADSYYASRAFRAYITL